MVDSDVTAKEQPFRNDFSTVFFVVAVSVLVFLGRSAFAPLLLDVERTFGVGHAASSRLMVTFTLGYSLSMFGSGLVSQYVPHRRLVPITALLSALGMVLLAVAPSMAVMNLGLIIFGIGAGMFVPTAVSMISAAVQPADWQRAFAINEMSPHMGMILAPLLVAAVRPVLDWRWIFAFVAFALVAAALFFMVRVTGGNLRGQAPNLGILGQLLRRREFWILLGFFGLSLAGTDGVYLLIPTFLVTEGGVDPRLANTIFGISRFMPLVSLFLAALLFDKIGSRFLMIAALAGQGIALVVVGLSGGWLRLAVVFVQPAIGALFFPAGFAALSALLPPVSRNVGVSMTLPVAVFLGVGVIPAVMGFLGENFSFAGGFTGLGIVMVVSSLAAFFGRF